MPASLPPLTIDQLTIEQRLELIGHLWDSIPDNRLPIPQWHRELLDERLAAADSHPEQTIPWEEVKQQIRDVRAENADGGQCLAVGGDE